MKYIIPEKASTVADFFDTFNIWLTIASVFFTVAICGAMLYFAFKYRSKHNRANENGLKEPASDEAELTPRIYGNHLLEIVWTAIPTVVVVVIAWVGIVLREKMFEIKDNAIPVYVTAWKWAWEFKYSTGKKSSGQNAELVVPVNKPVKLVLSSKDVIHSLFIPAARVKQDAVPGQYKYMTFTATKTGEYPIFCTEYCGTRHAFMMAKLRVVSEEEFNAWVNTVPEKSLPPRVLGRKLYSDLGCNACHSVEQGVRLVGSSFYDLYGSERKFTDGTYLVADENYIKESILYPARKVVEGYPAGVMPSYLGRLTEDELNALVSFIVEIKSIPTEELVEVVLEEESKVDLESMSPVERGKYLYEAKGCNACHSVDGTVLVGPSFKGVYGKTREFADGTSRVADDEYLRESILRPNDKVVKGFVAAMPSYEGQLTDEEISYLIEFIKSLQ